MESVRSEASFESDPTFDPDDDPKAESEVDPEDHKAYVKFEVSDVAQPILSVSRLLAMGHNVVFEPNNNWLVGPSGQRVQLLVRDGLFLIPAQCQSRINEISVEGIPVMPVEEVGHGDAEIHDAADDGPDLHELPAGFLGPAVEGEHAHAPA